MNKTRPRGATTERAEANPSTPTVDVLFLGTHGQANIGDELLLETFLAELGSEHHYRVNSYVPVFTRARLEDRYDVDVFDTAGDRVRLLRHVLQCDVVVFGGGSIVKELGPTTGRRRHATLWMLLALVSLARLARRPVLMSNIGVGPIRTPFGRVLARRILRQASLISVRDGGSLELCNEFGCDPARVRLVPDAVWANDVDRLGRAAAVAADGDDVLRLGLNLNRDIAVPDRWDAFLDELRDAIRDVAATRPIEIVGLPMQSGFKSDDDFEMLEKFLGSLPEIESSLHPAADHHDIVERAAGCDVVLAERLHALILGAIIGRPLVALSYDPKVDELVDQLDLHHRAVDVNEPFDPTRLATMICEAADDVGEGDRISAAAHLRRDLLHPYFGSLREWLARRGSASSWAELGG